MFNREEGNTVHFRHAWLGLLLSMFSLFEPRVLAQLKDLPSGRVPSSPIDSNETGASKLQKLDDINKYYYLIFYKDVQDELKLGAAHRDRLHGIMQGVNRKKHDLAFNDRGEGFDKARERMRKLTKQQGERCSRFSQRN